MESKIKEKKDKAGEFLYRNRKKILYATVATVAAVGVYMYSTNDCDEEYDIDGNDDDNDLDFNSLEESNIGSDSQTRTPRTYPKRDIGGIDVTGSRFTEYQKNFLENFSNQYDKLKGKTYPTVDTIVGPSSDGKYTCNTSRTYSFAEDKMAINVDIIREYDDGQKDKLSYTIENGRDLINFKNEHENFKLFDDLQDTVDI